MKVKELIQNLETLPEDVEFHVYDGNDGYISDVPSFEYDEGKQIIIAYPYGDDFIKI